MASVGDLTIEVGLDVSAETAAACVAVLNIYLKNGTDEAFVERDENGIAQISVYKKHKATIEQ